MWYIIQWNTTQPHKGWNHSIWSNMDGPRDYHTKWSKRKREEYHGITYMWNLKKNKWTTLFTKQKQTHRYRKQSYGYQMKIGG